MLARHTAKPDLRETQPAKATTARILKAAVTLATKPGLTLPAQPVDIPRRRMVSPARQLQERQVLIVRRTKPRKAERPTTAPAGRTESLTHGGLLDTRGPRPRAAAVTNRGTQIRIDEPVMLMEAPKHPRRLTAECKRQVPANRRTALLPARAIHRHRTLTALAPAAALAPADTSNQLRISKLLNTTLQLRLALTPMTPVDQRATRQLPRVTNQPVAIAPEARAAIQEHCPVRQRRVVPTQRLAVQRRQRPINPGAMEQADSIQRPGNTKSEADLATNQHERASENTGPFVIS